MRQVKFSMLLEESKRDSLLRIIGKLHDAARLDEPVNAVGAMDKLDESALWEMFRALQRTKADQLGTDA